jgi:hypothetical protein
VATYVYPLLIVASLILSSGCFPVVGLTSNDVVFETGLTLSGDDEQVFENKEITIRRSLVVEGSAILRFVNCTISLIAISNGDTQHLLMAEDGTLDLVNSSVWINVDLIPNLSTSGRIRVQDNAVFNVIDSKITCTSNMRLVCTDMSKVFFSGSEYYGKAPQSGLHWIIEDMLPEELLRDYFDHYRLDGEVSSDIQITGSWIGNLNVYQNASCTINDSEISLLNPRSSVETLVEDSNIVVLSLRQSDAELDLTGSAGGFYSEWDSQTFFGPGHASPLRLKDTSFDHLWLYLVDCIAELHDADFWLLSTYGGETTLDGCDAWVLNLRSLQSRVEGSTVDYLIGQSADGWVHIEDSEVQWMGLTGYAPRGEPREVQASVVNSTVGSCAVNYWYITDAVNVTFRGVHFGNITMRPAPVFKVEFMNCTIAGNVTLNSQQGDIEVIHVGGDVTHARARALGDGSISLELSEISDPPVINEENGGSNLIPLVAALLGVILIVSVYKLRVSSVRAHRNRGLRSSGASNLPPR